MTLKTVASTLIIKIRKKCWLKEPRISQVQAVRGVGLFKEIRILPNRVRLRNVRVAIE